MLVLPIIIGISLSACDLDQSIEPISTIDSPATSTKSSTASQQIGASTAETQPPIASQQQALPSPTLTSRPSATQAQTATRVPSPEPIQRPIILEWSEGTVVYRSAGDICIMREGGPSLYLAAADGVSRVKVSGDGSVVAFVRHLDEYRAELWAINRDGTDERLLVTAADLAAFDPPAEGVKPAQFAWVPGTHTLLFNTRQVGYGLVYYDDLRSTEADSRVMQTLLTPGSGGQFSISPDGSQVALITAQTISLINTDGSRLREGLVSYPPVVTESEFRFYAAPVWAVDSRSLLVAIPSAEPSLPDATLSIWFIPVDGTTGTRLATFSVGRWNINFPAVFSPDSAHIAFVTLGEEGLSLNIARVDGSEHVTFAIDSPDFLGWTDAEHFTFMRAGIPQRGTVGGDFEPFDLTAVGPDPTLTAVLEAGC